MPLKTLIVTLSELEEKLNCYETVIRLCYPNSLQYTLIFFLSCSVVSDSVTPWTIRSMEFSRPEYWSGSQFPSPGDLPNPGIEPRPPALQVDSLPAELLGKPTLDIKQSNWQLWYCSMYFSDWTGSSTVLQTYVSTPVDMPATHSQIHNHNNNLQSLNSFSC